MNLQVEVSDDDRARLQIALGENVNVDRIIEIVAQAGVKEAIDYASGRAVFSSMADLRSYRIACLLGAGMKIPEAEALVASLFKVPITTARRLVNASLARYSVDLGLELRQAIAGVLDDRPAWDKPSGRWLVSLPSRVIRDRILGLLSQENLPDPVMADRGALWKIPNETYQWLRMRSGLARTEPPK